MKVMSTRVSRLALAIAALTGTLAHAEEAVLKAVQVRASTESTVNRTGASKTATPLRDLPQAVTVVERELIEAQGALEMKDVLRNVSSVAINQGEGRRDQFYIRGLDAARDTLIDGVRDDSQYFRELANIERVEVLKGPAAALYGRGSAGGAINRVSKKPLATQRTDIGFTVGSEDLRRTELDTTGPLTSGLRYRVAAAYEDGGSFRDVITSERRFIAPSLAIDLAERTALLLQLEYLKQSRTPDRGLPSVNGRPASVPISNFYGERYDYADTEASNVRLRLDHAFSEQLSLAETLSWSRTELEAMNTRHTALTANGLQLRRNVTFFPQQQDGLLSQTELTLQAQTGSVKHTVLAGLEVARQDFDRETRQVNVAMIDLYDPQHVLTRPDPTTMPISGFTGADSTFDADTEALYLQDQLEFSAHWKALLGVRWDRFAQEQHNRANGITEKRDDSITSPRAGLVYQPNQWLALYASAAKSSQPIGGDFFYNTGANRTAFADIEPLETHLQEVGAKLDTLGGRLSGTVALFKLNQSNRLTPNPANSLQMIQNGELQSRGLEVDATAHLSAGWLLTTSWIYNDTKIAKSNDAAIANGNRPGNIPAHQGSVWSEYRWSSGFGIGAGVFGTGARYATDDNTVRLPGYTRVDATGFYEQDRYRIALVLNNIADAAYYESANNNMQIGPGAPFNWRLQGRISL